MRATCPAVNRFSTMLLGIALSLQPLCINYFTYSTSNPKARARSSVLLHFIVAFTIIQILIQLNRELVPYEALHEYEVKFMKMMQLSDQQTEGAETCSYLGPNGHLAWKFKSVLSESMLGFPYGVVYYIGGYIVPCIMHRPWMRGGSIILFGFFVSLFTVFYFQNIESYSTWCWSGIMMHLITLAYPWVFTEQQQNQTTQ